MDVYLAVSAKVEAKRASLTEVDHDSVKPVPQKH